MSVAPASRNAPCPCGSGERYKDCHGALSQREPAVANADGPSLARAQREITVDADAAVKTCRQLLADPAIDAATAVAAYNLLGSALRATDPAESLFAWQQALALDAKDAEANFHLGNLEREAGKPEQAIEYYNHALKRVPGHAGVLNNLGLALEASGDRGGAERCYREVLAVAPQHSDALANLANLELSLERYADSAITFDRLFAIVPSVPAAVWAQRAMAQKHSGDMRGAQASLYKAARLAPDNIDVQLNLANACLEEKQWAAVEPPLLRALELDAGNLYGLSMLAHARQHRCRWIGLDTLFADINRTLEADDGEGARHPANPFPILAMPTSPLAQLNASKGWARGIAQSPRPVRPRLESTSDRLRVAFVSSDFRDHAMAHLSMEYWERIDRDRFETFAYGLSRANTGKYGTRIARAFDVSVDVSAENATAIAQRIRADRIAVLIDLNGYTTHARERIFALRPAPVQVNMIGFPGTLGADWYDYILVDHFGAPEAMQGNYTERLLHMPNASFPSDTSRAPKAPAPSRAECGLPEDAFVFCCFNRVYKILPAVFAIWMRLLKAVPGSVLWLMEDLDEAAQNLRNEASAAGVDPARLIFAQYAQVEEHVARHAVADLFLDSYPYGAHTTTNDALLAGLPVVTCAGETLVTRLAGSQLRAIGLSDMVTFSFSDYEALALRLALDREALASVRARIAANRSTWPLFDMARYTRDFEQLLLTAWGQREQLDR